MLAITIAVLAAVTAVMSRQWVMPGSESSYRRRLARLWADWYGLAEHRRLTLRREARAELDHWLRSHPSSPERESVETLRGALAPSSGAARSDELLRAVNWRLQLQTLVAQAGETPGLGAESPDAVATARELAQRLLIRGNRLVESNVAETEAFVGRLGALRAPDPLIERHRELLASARAYLGMLEVFRDAYVGSSERAALTSLAERVVRAGEDLGLRASELEIGDDTNPADT